MVKSIFKELIIVLLLLLAIILVLGVFMYDYMPMNKIVPKTEQYQAPETVKEELEQNVNDVEETQPIVYEIDGSDLKTYEKTKDYQKGKVNPFGTLDTQPVTTNSVNGNTTNNNNVNTNSNTNNNVNNNNTSNSVNNSNSTGNYLPNKGTK